MQDTSQITNYDTIIEAGDYLTETKLVINNVDYGESELWSMNTYRAAFDEYTPLIGNAYIGRIEATIKTPSVTIPKAAEMRPYVRIFNDTLVSGWIPKGVFYIYQRSVDNESGTVTFEGYDAMYRAEQSYPSSALTWDSTHPDARSVLNEIAGFMGVVLDDATKTAIPTNTTYLVQFPAQYSMRDILGSIAAMYNGNFCMNDIGKLLFIKFGDLPPQS